MCFFTVAQAIFTIVFVLLKMHIYIVYEPDTLIGTSQRDKLPYGIFHKVYVQFKKKCDIPADLAAFCTNIHVLLCICTLIYIKNTYYVIQN